MKSPRYLFIFFKPPTSLIGPGDTILLAGRLPPGWSSKPRLVSSSGSASAMWMLPLPERSIGGYICVNDVTCRDLQKVDGQWGRAKGFDTFCPVGPRIGTGLDWRELELICRVNGTERQRAKATDMHFSIPELVAFLSGIMTLGAGRPHRHRHAGRNRPTARW